MTEILIADETPRSEFSPAAGTANLPNTWPIFEDDHIVVIRTRSSVVTTLTEGVDYTVTGVGVEAGFTVVLSPVSVDGDDYVVFRDTPIERTSDFQDGGDFEASTLNRQLDILTMISQDLELKINRSLTLSDDAVGVSTTLPTPSANKAIIWNATGDALITSTDDFNDIVTDATAQATAAATSASNASTSETNAAASAAAALVSETNAAASAASINLPALSTPHGVLQENAAGDGYETALIDKDNIATDAVETDKIKDDAVTYAKIASAAEASILATNKSTANEYTKAQNFDATTLTDAASISWDASNNQVTSVTLTDNRTLANPTNTVDGGTYVVIVKQDATGGRTLSFGSNFKWPGGTAPTLSTAANAVDVLTFVCDGTDLLGVFQGDFQ